MPKPKRWKNQKRKPPKGKTRIQLIIPNDVITVSFELKNTGNMAADEVVQAYVHRINTSVEWPEKELKAFSRVALNPGEIKTVTLEIPVKNLQYWNEKKHACDLLKHEGEFVTVIGYYRVSNHEDNVEENKFRYFDQPIIGSINTEIAWQGRKYEVGSSGMQYGIHTGKSIIFFGDLLIQLV